MDLPQTFQAVGARGVNNLASKLSQTLFPTTLPFMRLELSPADLAKLEQQSTEEGADEDGMDATTRTNRALQLIEQQAVSEFDMGGWRPVVAEAFRKLVVTGNCLIYDRPGGDGPSLNDLRNYVVERDASNRVICIVLRESINKVDAENALGAQLTEQQKQSSSKNPAILDQPSEKQLDLYTGAYRLEDGRFGFHQEIAGTEVPDSYTVYNEVDLPLIPLQFSPIYGQSYGRGYVEDYDGDLLVLNQISRALSEAALVMSKVIFLTRPGSTTKANVIDKAPNGSVRVGNAEDIGAVQADKSHDLMVAYNMRNDLTTALSKAFLLNSSVQRNAERVTGEEIRYVSMELEDALGGVYASLADTVQRPIVEYFYSQLQRSGKIRQMPPEVQPVVAAGLDAISRNHKAVRIQQLIGGVQQLVPADQLVKRIKVENVVTDYATALNLDSEQYLRSQEEIDMIEQQEQQMLAAQSMMSQVPQMLQQEANPPQQ